MPSVQRGAFPPAVGANSCLDRNASTPRRVCSDSRRMRAPYGESPMTD